VKVVREVETKLAVSDDFVLPHLADVEGVDRVAVSDLHLRATHYDSADLRLAQTGTTLRHRTGQGRAQWTLKLPTAAAAGLDRQELTVEAPGTRVPPALQDLVTAPLRGARLHQVVELRTRRTTHMLLDLEGHELVEVVDDHVDVVRGTTVERSWRELEVEQRERGGAGVAERVLALLCQTGAEVGDQTPKAVRALGRGAEPPAAPARVRPKDPAGALVRWSLGRGYAALLARDLDVRLGKDDAVHQLRVTCRRMRSDLRTFRPLLGDPRAEQLRAELSWLAGSFGVARDLEVLRDRLRVTAREDPLQPIDESAVDALLSAQEQVAQERALSALRSPRHLELLQLLHDVAAEPGLGELASRRCDDVLPDLVDLAWAKLARRAGKLHVGDPDDAWHRVRILAKRARYSAEAVEVALGKRVRPQARAAARAQTHLGEHQDAVVAAARVLALADDNLEDHRLAVACGRLAERERAHVLEARREFLKACKQLGR
jgi:CHAD domain-containing protein